MDGVNITLLRRDIDKHFDKSIYPTAKRRLEKEVDTAKKELLKEFESSPITEELREASQGAAHTRSKFLQEGNLYGLFGFTQSDGDPTAVIEQVLEERVRITSVSRRGTNDKMVYRVEMRVETPTLEELKNITNETHPLEWTGRSWLDLIKRGVGGFQRTIFKQINNSSSRSEIAIQSKSGNVRAATFNGVGIPYLSEFLAEFRKKIRGQD